MPEAMRALLERGVGRTTRATGLQSHWVVAAAAGGGPEDHRLLVGLAVARQVASVPSRDVIERVMRWYGDAAPVSMWSKRTGLTPKAVRAILYRVPWADSVREGGVVTWWHVDGQWPEVTETRKAQYSGAWQAKRVRQVKHLRWSGL